MIQELARTLWYGFLIALGLFCAGALLGIVAMGYRSVVG